MKGPVIGFVRTLDDCIRALNNIRAYFNETQSVLTTANVNDSKDRRYVTDAQLSAIGKLVSGGTTTTVTQNTVVTVVSGLVDVGGTGKGANIQVRFMGLNPDGSDYWQLEVVSK